MLVWLQHEKDCFDNPTTYLPYMEGKADSKLCCKHSAISCSKIICFPIQSESPQFEIESTVEIEDAEEEIKLTV